MKRQSKRLTSGGQESPEPGDQSLLPPYMEHDEADLEEEDEIEEQTHIGRSIYQQWLLLPCLQLLLSSLEH